MRFLLRERRETAGLSQEELARRVGVSVFTVSRWELGKHSPPVDRLYDLADALGCHVHDLIEENGGPA